ncbi:Os12g0463400 [Oryza sativa Japonica Group]|uniref:Os12g0463400 protein n=2 Tax=Oryza sativa subsp. japonica TaxID=39947 RepID=Q2QRF5_ORYSJ|nr:hypothetical protein LOC_Os12g27740 [Oryza sativa Japonica Group]EAZ20414.1 hypothetical protein OsJ_36023 [Oryza sativa Japonica Group]BAT17058.1 Os12g0463400 [Oryza sativa Japonica Group]
MRRASPDPHPITTPMIPIIPHPRTHSWNRSKLQQKMKINRARNVVWGKLVVMVEERVEAMEVDVGYIYYELVAMEDEAVAQIDEGGATTSAPQPCHHHSSSAATTSILIACGHYLSSSSAPKSVSLACGSCTGTATVTTSSPSTSTYGLVVWGRWEFGRFFRGGGGAERIWMVGSG